MRQAHANRCRAARLAKLGKPSLPPVPARQLPDLDVPVIDRRTGLAVRAPKLPPTGHRAERAPRPPKVIVVPLAKPKPQPKPKPTPKPLPKRPVLPPWRPPAA